MVDVDGSFEKTSLCSDSLNTLLVILLRLDTKALAIVSYCNGNGETNGFIDDNAFSCNLTVVWTALLLNLCVINT